MAKIPISITLSEEVIKKIEEIKQKENRDTSNVIETLIKKQVGMLK